jgi:hypothetical protein
MKRKVDLLAVALAGQSDARQLAGQQVNPGRGNPQG